MNNQKDRTCDFLVLIAVMPEDTWNDKTANADTRLAREVCTSATDRRRRSRTRNAKVDQLSVRHLQFSTVGAVLNPQWHQHLYSKCGSTHCSVRERERARHLLKFSQPWLGGSHMPAARYATVFRVKPRLTMPPSRLAIVYTISLLR